MRTASRERSRCRCLKPSFWNTLGLSLDKRPGDIGIIVPLGIKRVRNLARKGLHVCDSARADFLKELWELELGTLADHVRLESPVSFAARFISLCRSAGQASGKTVLFME